jgi:hypothetical protein
MAFDNVSHMPNWLSDTLCRLATGGGFATRQLYTDGEEMLFDSCRPILLNGIEDFVTRADLADRTVFLGLQPIADQRSDGWPVWLLERPRIGGAAKQRLRP